MKRFGTMLVTIVALGLLAVSPAGANTSWTGKAPANATWTGKTPANTSWTGKAPANTSWTGKAPADVRQRTRPANVRLNADWTWRVARVAPLSWSDGN